MFRSIDSRTNVGAILLQTALATSLVACAGGDGDLKVTIYGEEFIEEGIPAADVGDGWAIFFDQFAVTVTGIEVGGVAIADPAPLDISVATQGAGQVLGTASTDSGEHAEAKFTLGHIQLKGRGGKDGVTKSFDWAFHRPVQYANCEATTMVPEGGTGTLQITVHADHFFYDSLVSAEPAVLFQALADADANGDGVIAQTELAARNIGSYDPGNEDISDLWSWLLAQSRTLGHVDGESHCEVVSP